MDPGDSLVDLSATKPSRLRPILAVAIAIGLVAAGWWFFGRGKGQPEDPARVLVVGPTPELTRFLEDEGFDVDHLSFGVAVGEGRSFDADLDELAAVIEYADQHGYGYLALNLAHGQSYEFGSAGYEGEAPPEGTTFAVLSIGDLGKHLSFGGVVPGVYHEPPGAEEVGLLLALFGQPELAKATSKEATNDLMIRFGSAGTMKDLEDYEQGQENMRRQKAAWDALKDKERGESKPVEIAAAYERVLGWPLANGQILLASGRGAWRSSDGRSSTWQGSNLSVDFSVVGLDFGEREPCDALPDTLALDDGFAVAPAGDALLIPTQRAIADLWVLSGPGCGFERRDQIRRLQDGELGKPRASGRTAEVINGQLMWADAKMRAYRRLRVAGLDLRNYALRWAGEDVVVVPATLDFAVAADSRARRQALAAMPEGSLELPPEPELVDPATLPDNREALVWLRLPPPKDDETLEVAVVPVNWIHGDPSRSDPTTLSIIEVFPLPARDEDDTASEVVALIDGPEGSSLIRVAVPMHGEPWGNALSLDFDLAATVDDAPSEARHLADTLPHEAVDLAISPDGSHAAWAAPAGEAPADDPLRAYEILLLPLGVEGAEPVRMTTNDRADLSPRFAGEKGSVILFDSSYRGAEELPQVEATRALPLP